MRKRYSLFFVLILVCLSMKAEFSPFEMQTVCFQSGTINTMPTNTRFVSAHTVPVAEVYSPASMSSNTTPRSLRRNGRDEPGGGNPSDPYMDTPLGDVPVVWILVIGVWYVWRTKIKSNLFTRVG